MRYSGVRLMAQLHLLDPWKHHDWALFMPGDIVRFTITSRWVSNVNKVQVDPGHEDRDPIDLTFEVDYLIVARFPVPFPLVKVLLMAPGFLREAWVQ